MTFDAAMKKIIIQAAVIALTAIASWKVSGYYHGLKPFLQDKEVRAITPAEFKEFRSNVAVWARAEVTPHDELVLGMAHMAYLNTMLAKTKGMDAASSNRLAVIRSLFQMYPDKNWGSMTEIVDQMKAGIRANPDVFPNISIEPTGPRDGVPAAHDP